MDRQSPALTEEKLPAQEVKKKKVLRYTGKRLAAAVVCAVLGTAAAILGALYLLLGSEGLALVESVALARSRFVGEYDPQAVVDGAMMGFVYGLGDRWSYYVDAERYQEVILSQENQYVGIGCTILPLEDGGLEILSVTPDGPSDQAGLTAGDVILEVDGVPMTGEAQAYPSQYTRGEEGSVAVLRIRHRDGAQATVEVTRAPVWDAPAEGKLLEGGVGLVTLKNFNRGSAQCAIDCVEDLVGQGATKLVFDVRNNGGGFVDELVELLDYLLPEGPIFQSGDKGGHTVTRTSDERCLEMPMAVLVNGNTYSAAEFFAAQLREMDWAVVVGEPTFGKGFSQQLFRLPTGGAVNLSTGTYRTGGGVSLVGTGVTLDEEVALPEELAPYLNAHVLEPKEDPQLQAARALLDE